MTWTLAASGTWDPAGTTEETVATADTTNGTYVFSIDANSLTNGNQLTVHIYSKALTGGVSRKVFSGRWRNVQAHPIKQSIPLASDIEVTVKAICSDATLTFPWKLLQG